MNERVSEELTEQVDDVYREAEEPTEQVDRVYKETFGQVFTVEQRRNGIGDEAWYYIHSGIHKPEDGVFRDDIRQQDHRRGIQPNCDLLMPGEAMVVWQNEKSLLHGPRPISRILENRNGHARVHGYSRRAIRKLESRGVVLKGSLLAE